MPEKRKICPLMLQNINKDGGVFFGTHCMGSDCAWWCDWAKRCAIPLTAEILADSSICQNVWD